jgi:hypothetical protein
MAALLQSSQPLYSSLSPSCMQLLQRYQIGYGGTAETSRPRRVFLRSTIMAAVPTAGVVCIALRGAVASAPDFRGVILESPFCNSGSDGNGADHLDSVW